MSAQVQPTKLDRMRGSALELEAIRKQFSKAELDFALGLLYAIKRNQVLKAFDGFDAARTQVDNLIIEVEPTHALAQKVCAL